MSQDKPYFTVSYHDDEKNLNVAVVGNSILFKGHASQGGTLTYLSILGPHSAVKGILAAIAMEKDIKCDSYPQASLSARKGGKSMTQALSRKVVHGIYLSPDLLLDSSERIAVLDDSPEKVYRRLIHSFAVPTIPEWAGWLYDTLKKENLLAPLVGKGGRGVSIEASEESLEALISRGVREKAIWF